MRTSLCLDLHIVGLAPWFPTRDDLAPLGHLKYLEIFLVVMIQRRVLLESSG